MEPQSRHAMLQDVPSLQGVNVFFVKVSCVHNQNYIPKARAIYRIMLHRNIMTCETVLVENFQFLQVKIFKINTEYCETTNCLEIDLVVKSRYNIMFNHFMSFDYNINNGIFEMKTYELADDVFIPAIYYVTFYNDNEDYNANDH